MNLCFYVDMLCCQRSIIVLLQGFVAWTLPKKGIAKSALCRCRGGAEAAATAAAERAADTAQANLLENLPQKLDEFGRDENMEVREAMSRQAQKRNAQYKNAPVQPQVRHQDRQ